MTSINHSNNLSLVTLHFPSSTPPSSSAASPSSPSSTGWTKKITKKIQELKSKLDNLKNLKETKNGYLSEKDSKSLDSLPTQLASLETVHKLAEFADQLDTKNNPSNNILNNLCTGLETFLGFNSETKGYTGQGIVYSDLDRLCDAVMGFLSGVLSNIQGHLGQHNEQITNAITSLETNKHGGKIGFNSAIVKVVEGVRGYNDGVRDSSNRVINPIKILQENVKHLKNQVSELDENNSAAGEIVKTVDRAEMLAKQFLDVSQAFCNKLTDNDKHILDLNSNCRNRVNVALKNVSYEGKRLYKLAEKEREDLKSMEEEIKSVHQFLKKEIQKELTEQNKELIKKVKDKMSDLLIRLRLINDYLRQYVYDLEMWIEGAQHIVNDAQTNVEKIIVHSNGGSGSWKGIIEKIGQDLKHTNSGLQKYINDVRRELKDMVSAAEYSVIDLDIQLKEALTRMEKEITGPLNALVNRSGAFFAQFTAAQKAFESAINIVAGDLQKLQSLTEIEEIQNSNNRTISAPLIKAIGGTSDPFGNITTYFGNLNTKVMEPIRTVIARLGAALGRNGPSPGSSGLNAALTVVKEKLQEVQNVIKGDVPSPDITAIKLDGATVAIENVRKLNESLATHSNVIENVISKLGGTSSVVIDKSEANKLLTALASIAQSVSSHSRTVVEAVMDGIKKQIGSEVKGVAGEIARKVNRIKTASRDHTDVAKYGDAVGQTAAGIPWLVARFQSKIKQEIEVLNKTVVKQTFKRTGWDDTIGVDQTLVEYAGEKGKTKLKKEIEELNNYSNLIDLEPTIKALTTLTTELNNYFGSLMNEMSKIGNNISVALRNMNADDIESRLKNIERNFNNVRTNDLLNVIELINIFVTKDADGLCDATIKHLTQFISIQVDNSTRLLTTAARRNYVTSVKQLLTAFADKVSQELRGLPEEIDRDLTIGFKGLMRVMGGNKYVVKANGSANFENLSGTELFDAISQIAPSLTSKLNGADHLQKFKKLSTDFDAYFANIYGYVNHQITPNPVPQPPTKDRNVELLTDVKSKFTELFTHLKNDVSSPRTYIFDHTYTKKHESLSSSLASLHPSHFANPRHPELLDAVRAGLQGFVDEMGKVYVNGYDGSENVTFFGFNTKQITDDGKNCAKIFLTILKTLRTNLYDLYEKCEDKKGKWKNDNICLYDVDKQFKANGNPLGHWFQRRGYKVPKDKNTQDGELRNSEKLKGNEIIKLCHNQIDGITSATKNMLGKYAVNGKQSVKLINLLIVLHDFKLHELYKVCHLNMRPNPKPPTTIYHMMQWLPGLVYSPMLDKICDYAKELFGKPKGDEAKKYSEIATTSLTLSATSEIKYDDVKRKITNACLYSHDTLVAILGNGHAGGRYAVDFCTNEDNFIYPSSPSSCFDMLVDILNRVYFQLYFLYKQCHNGRSSGGWEDCYYGRHVGGSAWTCNEEQCGNLSCPQKAQQKDDQTGNQIADQGANQNEKQTADQTCNQHPTCGVKSPLQSFLEDGLQGFLPHQLTKVGCGVKCLVTNHFGKPCLTPMGFSDIGVTASHTKDGKYLKQALYNFCSSNTHLSELCGMLNCLLRQAPQTLGDMFAFYYRFLHHWSTNNEHQKKGFDLAVQKANFGESTTELDVASIQNSSDHKKHVSDDGKKYTGDLFTLSSCNPSRRATVPCGPYLQSLSNDMRVYFSKDHGSTYLSWVVYMTETFYDLLKKLYDECCKNCNEPGSRCHDRSCVRDCQVNYCYEHNKPTPEEGKGEFIRNIRHGKLCNSIIQCRNTHATLYAAGFTFGSPAALTDHADKTKRTCQDFCKALEKVCSDSSVLARLVHDYIPKFLWQIREKFFWTTVALWSLSLLYLICVMVGRLDVLHIRSHLRIPSSHKITAQSLLAAAQVGRLAKISYLQP